MPSRSIAPGVTPKRLVSPIVPHLGEECWVRLGESGMAVDAPWPSFDPALAADEEIALPIQVNGKRRAEFAIAKDADPKLVEKAALEQDGVVRALEGKAPKKVIVVPNRIVNIVA